jgi:hypothetical protein
MFIESFKIYSDFGLKAMEGKEKSSKHFLF